MTITARHREGSASGVEAAIAKRAFKQVWVGATVCAVAFGGTAASSALTYVSSFPTAVSRQQLAATTGRDTGLSVLLGPISSIGTVGGYTFYKVFVFLTTIGAIWALLAATRGLRGEEDAGRWQVVLAGSTRPARATAATLAALFAAVGVVFIGTTAVTVLAGRDSEVAFGVGGSVLFGLSLVVAPAVFVGVGAIASQLSRTRRGATSLGIITFGVMFVLRMIADTGPGTRWLLWATPFGWTERMHPFTENAVLPLVPAVLTVLGLAAAAVVLAATRDAGDGVLASRDVAPLRPFGLRSVFGLTARRELPVLAAWCVGALAWGLMFGVIGKVITSATPGSIGDALEKFDVRGSLSTQYFGVAFLLVAMVVALVSAGQVGAAGDEETSGRLVHVLAGATSRTSWFAGRLALTGAAIVLAGVLAGFGTWLGAKSQGVHVAITTMLGAGLNVVPIALVALGAGAVMLSLAPRAAAATVYSVIVGSVLIDLAASLVSSLSRLKYLSLFHYMALVPAQDASPATVLISISLALVLALVATALFRYRDLQTA
jgi:ABC-2 type transport system permease protein